MAAPQTANNYRATVRMYRQGLGDCFLIRLPRQDGGKDFFVMIDCGVIQGTPNAAGKMADVLDDIAKETGGEVDLLLATHEHWDHLSGFVQAEESLKKLTFKEVWLAWTEDPEDKQAQALVARRTKALAALQATQARLHLSGEEKAAAEVASLVEFFGAARRGTSTKDALEKVRKLAPDGLRYCAPEDAPTKFEGVDARFYVLGPPRDPKLLRKTLPSKGAEGYGMDRVQFLLDSVAPCLDASGGNPFSPMWTIPVTAAQTMPFFRERYWSDRPGVASPDAWRRIDGAWLEGSTEMALQLDSETNNTSLVLAIELGDQSVLLFAADAQVGSWLSWQNLEWGKDPNRVTGPDLLKRTRLYKVGHHGSHNATLREMGLEQMPKLQVAFLSVNKDMAMSKKWNRMPLEDLVRELTKKTGDFVVRSDFPLPAGASATTETNELYHEVCLP
jgi:hypothetical protein